ncbi:MAG: DUF4253 domain-containing protein [Rhodothermaceae bacterium]
MKLRKIRFIYIGIFVLFSFFPACSQIKELSNDDKKLISELGFDTELIQKIRSLTDSTFVKKIGNNEYWNFKNSLNYVDFLKKGLVGFQISESREKALMIVKQLREEFRANGYFIYVSDFNFGYSPDIITVLKTNDKFDLLRFECTNGVNYDIYIEDVIDKISGWDKKYGLDIVGVGFDFVRADYEKLPNNINQYVKDLYDFCPDIVNQGVGTVDALKREIERTKELYLWWD